MLLHGGFFLGPKGFYAALRDLPESERRQFNMTSVSFINQLYGADMALRIEQRQHARFINTAMMMTLTGAAISDGLADGRVVSGVGGQYNFVAMAHALPGAHSVLCVRSTRTRAGRTVSNLVWNYGHCTIPRHLRDVVITEYGIAMIRGREDREVIAALINIADSRFQEDLLRQAQAAGKLSRDYRIPDIHRNNTPESREKMLAAQRRAGLFSDYPFGTDFTSEEIVLAKALGRLRERTGTLEGQGRRDRGGNAPRRNSGRAPTVSGQTAARPSRQRAGIALATAGGAGTARSRALTGLQPVICTSHRCHEYFIGRAHDGARMAVLKEIAGRRLQAEAMRQSSTRVG